MHNDHLLPGGLWPATAVPTPGRLRKLDERTFQALNGAAGGTWEPETPIFIGGEGVSLVGNLGSSTLTGEVRTGRGAVGLVCGNNDYPTFESARSRTVVLPLRPYSPLNSSLGYYSIVTGSRSGVRMGSDSGAYYDMVWRPTRMHVGATISRIRLRLIVGEQPATLPATFPSFSVARIKRADLAAYVTNERVIYAQPVRVALGTYAVGDVVKADGNAAILYCTVAGTASPIGIAPPGAVGTTVTEGTVTWRIEGSDRNSGALPKPDLTLAGYYAGGSVREAVMVPNVNTTISASYSYRFRISDGTQTDNLHLCMIVELTGIADFKPTG